MYTRKHAHLESVERDSVRRVGRVKKVDGKVNADSLQSLTLRLVGCEGESRANRELAVAGSHSGTHIVGRLTIRDILYAG